MRFEYVILVISLLILLIYKITNVKKEQNITTLFFSTGIAFITASFESLSDKVFSFVRDIYTNQPMASIPTSNINYVSLATGLGFIFIGFYSFSYLKDRYYVLNIHGRDKRRIIQESNIKDLKLTEFKIREREIDFVRIFDDENNITKNNCKYINDEIEEKTIQFVYESNGHKKSFTGLAPIPFTVLAGSYLSSTEFTDYHEYNRNDKKYHKLRNHWKVPFWKRNKYQKLIIKEDYEPSNLTNEVVVAISTTRQITNNDLKQFEQLNVVRIYVEHPKDNLIDSIDQLRNYTQIIGEELENLKNKYEDIENIHLVMATQSCLALEVGKRISLNRNRQIPIISYHYKADCNPRYIFGIIVTDKDRGNLVI